jgi:hypothetical protein
VNECRYTLFCAKSGEIDSRLLLPAQDCLRQHVLRANYQTGVWRHALQACAEIPSPHGHGLSITKTDDDQDKLEIQWMTGLPAPMAVIEMLACQCKETCDKSTCSCILSGMNCTDMCTLKACENRSPELDQEVAKSNEVDDCYSDDDDDDEDEDEDEDNDSFMRRTDVVALDELLLDVADEEEVQTSLDENI